MVAPEVTVIICTRDGAGTIGGALDSLAAQRTTVEWELVVCDNGSADDTVAVVRGHPELGARARIVDASSRPGLGNARNSAVEAARGRYVAFVDDDDEVAPDWLEELTRVVRIHRFAGSRMDYEKLNPPADMVGRAAFQSDSLGSIFGYPVVNGACGVERDLWNRVGGNDPSLDRSGEDFDFAIRVQRKCDVRPVLAERAVYHYRQRTGFRSSLRQGYRYGRGHVSLFARYGGDESSSRQTRRAAQVWWWLVTRAPVRIVSRRRSVWARQLGIRLGRLAGSVREGRWCP